MSDLIRVLIADDHVIVRSGVRLLLDAEADIEVVGEALDGSEAIALAKTLQPDVILMDISMPAIDGLEATRRIRASWPEINVLILTMHRSDEYFFEALKADASGYVLKAAETSELIRAVRIVSQGEVFLYPTMARKLVRGYLDELKSGTQPEPALSPREEEIMRLLVEGYNNTEIAEKLVLSLSTVHTHRGNLMNKLGLKSRHELIQYARQRGMIP
jgi:two-component system response regulator NreC